MDDFHVKRHTWKTNMPRPRSVSHDILHAALAGLEAQKQKIEHQIAQVHAIVHGIGVGLKTIATGTAPVAEHGTGSKFRKRTMSAAGRKRIAAAQKKRWAAVRKATKRS
jgi:hypothetical protein